VSAVLFCVNLDGLLQAVNETKIGCYIGEVYWSGCLCMQMMLPC